MLVKNKIAQKSLLFAIISVFAITAAQLIGNTIIIAGALLIYLFTLFTADDETVFPLFLFFLPWSTILKLSPTSISFASIATILIFAKYFILKKFKMKWNILISVLGMAIVTLISKLIHQYSISPSYFMFFIMLVAFPYLLNLIGNKTDFAICVEFFSIGIILAAITSEIFGSNTNLMQYVAVFNQENIGVTRLCGFYGDPNFYSAQIVTAFGGLLLAIGKKGKNKVLDIILSVALVACGAISVSKSFLICLMLVLALWLVSILFYKPSKFIGIMATVMVIITISLASGAFDSIIEQYMIRFGLSDDISGLTTGRSELWAEYLDFLINNPIDLLFGQGYTSVFNTVHKGSHNTIIQCLYQFGVIGSIVLIAWISTMFTKKINLRKNILLTVVWIIACFSMWMGLDLLYFDDFFLIFALFSLGLNYIQPYVNSEISIGASSDSSQQICAADRKRG